MNIPHEAVEAAARALASSESSCFDEIDWWKSLNASVRAAFPEERPVAAYEYRSMYYQQARTALEAAAPFMGA